MALEVTQHKLPDHAPARGVERHAIHAHQPVGSSIIGLDRLHAAVRERPDATAQQLCDHLTATLAAYHGAAPQADDITLLAMRTS